MSDSAAALRFPSRRRASLWIAVAWLALLPGCQADRGQPPQAKPDTRVPAAAKEDSPLRFDIVEGRVLNAFYRKGPVAAHLLLSSGDAPRVLVAFPAGNSGTALWFDKTAQPVQWTLTSLRGVEEADASGRMRYGIEADATVDAPRLNVRQALLGNVRVIRDYAALGTFPDSLDAKPEMQGQRVRWNRQRLDGAPGYALSVEVLEGALERGDAAVTLSAAQGKPLRLRIRALSGDPPLTPLTGPRLLNAQAGADPRSRQALEFLSYEEKFLAGSWRFNTYFGRDTLMSVRLLLPALTPQAAEAGLGSVLARLNAAGEVAHEEDLGEFAILRRVREGQPPDASPIHDYGMIDDDFMLAPVAAAYLLDTPQGRERAAAFLARTMPSGESYGQALARNFAWVAQAAAPFAREAAVRHLIALKPDKLNGQWRDSHDGLGDGRYAYDVNAVFVPDALASIARFAQAGLLRAHATPAQITSIMQADALAQAWRRSAPPMFAVSIDAATARRAVQAYAQAERVDAAPALASMPADALRMNAIALDAAGKPIPVLHSDDGFALLFGDPPPQDLERSVSAMMRPFPAGLMTDIGLLVANPAHANASVRKRLGRNAYHGTVVWAWQQAVLAAGLERQLARKDLPEPLRAQLHAARAQLWRAIDNAREVRTSELWSWSQTDGRYRVEPFGQRGGDADESNAAQLWSTVFLALRPPPPESSASPKSAAAP